MATIFESPADLGERETALDELVSRSRQAAAAFRRLDQDAVDRIVHAMVVAGLEAALELAELAVEETGFGVLEDKVVKNLVATEFLHDYLRDKPTVGVIERDRARGLEYVAEPIGVVLAVLPITNPTSTVLFKAIVVAKTRNAVIFRPSSRAERCAVRAVEIMVAAGERAGLPRHALQVVSAPTREDTQHLFRHPGVDFIWTTGGQQIVQAAAASGKPGVGVGPGNAPVYLHASCDVPMAVVDILTSKTFDASVICPAEQTCVIDDAIYAETLAEFERMGARLLRPEETERLARIAFDAGGHLNTMALGQPVGVLAGAGGFDVSAEHKVLLAELPTDLDELAGHPLVQEKLMPILAVVRATSEEHALQVCDLVTERGGLGHTSAVYAREGGVAERFADRIRTGRILVNAPTAMGSMGGVYNELTPTFSLGCGTWGGSTTTENVNYRQLLNVKAVARRRVSPQWFRAPSETSFGPGAISRLRELRARRVVLVTSPGQVRRGVADEVRAQLGGAAVHVFPGVGHEPDEALVTGGVEVLREVRPDLIVAVGGGSVLDAAKAMRLFAGSPEASLRELTLPFLDPRKRVARFPAPAEPVRLVAVPTTAGSGSEVSPAAVIRADGVKRTLVDYSLVPDLAVVDPDLMASMPRDLAVDSGVDALSHALEAYVSVFSSSYTDALCVQAVTQIVGALPDAVDGDAAAQARMADAATIAGLAFSNAFLGVCHALSHAVGARFGIPHGRLNGVFLPHVLRYNAALPSKFVPAPGYTAYVAPARYARLGDLLGVGGTGEEEQRARFFARVDRLLADVGVPRTLAEAGVEEAAFVAAMPDLVRLAFADPSLRTNPRMPLLAELETLLRACYGPGRM